MDSINCQALLEGGLMQVVTVMRGLRRAQDLTQRQLSEQVGVSETLIAQVEQGRIQPYPKIKRLIAAELGVTVADIWGSDDS
jgi:DNA-binding XRE family transcriptional regulator